MRILLPTDGSEHSKVAAGYVRRLGFGANDEVVALHILKDFLVPDEVDAARDFKLAGRQRAERMLDEFRTECLPPGVPVRTVVGDGEPWREIVTAAVDLQADLVVMGHKGLSSLTEYVLGSTVRNVVRHSSVSCLVVRRQLPEDRPVRLMLCADGSLSSVRAREILAALPFGSSAEVDVLSVVDMDVTSLPEQFYPQEDLSKMMAELREHYRVAAQKTIDAETAALKGSFDDVDGLVRFGAPDEEIIAAASELGADLIALGCKAIKGLPDMILGSESLRVLKHADCNLLIAKTEGC